MAHSKGTWKIGTGNVVVTDDPDGFPTNSGDTETSYYGGYLIAESILKPDDAKLIAASKDLLVCLQSYFNLVSKADSKMEFDIILNKFGWYDRARAAIKKATE